MVVNWWTPLGVSGGVKIPKWTPIGTINSRGPIRGAIGKLELNDRPPHRRCCTSVYCLHLATTKNIKYNVQKVIQKNI
jgi:hypothetical protein